MSAKHTDERLKSWINGQQERERMCIDLMRLDGRFRDVRPRLPQGGPDGARDIEAVLSDTGDTVWGAVGFRNSVSDSAADKRWAKKKFNSDLATALKNNNTLRGFVFFTNVNLTPAEGDTCRQHAKSKGLAFVDIYHRERIRIELDSPTGLATRFQYLDLKLSDEEQRTFFAHWERFLGRRLDVIDSALQRIEFLHERGKPAQEVRLFLYLREPYPFDNVAPFEVAVDIRDRLRQHNGAIQLAARDRPPNGEAGISPIGWKPADGTLRAQIFGETRTDLLVVGRFDPEERLTVGDLEGRALRIFLRGRLRDALRGIAVTANRYLIYKRHIDGLVMVDYPSHLVPWPVPDEAKDESRLGGWTYILEGRGYLSVKSYPHIDYRVTPQVVDGPYPSLD